MPEADSESQQHIQCNPNNYNDRKISCETLANELPPESFYLSKEAEFDWYDKNAFLERKESAKGNTILSNSTSQRVTTLTTNKTTTFFGLPGTSSSIDSKRKSCKPVNIRFFPAKRSESALKAVSAPEPVSPKVSCMGRVRSKRSRRRSIEPAVADKKIERDIGVIKKTGFYSRVFAMFRFSKSGNIKPEKRILEELVVQVEPRKSCSVEPAGLGNMMRFKSGRRSGCWAAEEINVVTESLDAGPDVRN